MYGFMQKMQFELFFLDIGNFSYAIKLQYFQIQSSCWSTLKKHSWNTNTRIWNTNTRLYI